MERRRRKLENAEERLAKITGQPIHSIDTGIVFHSLFQTTCIYNGGKRCTCKFSNGESLIPFWKIWEWFSPCIFYLTNSEMKCLSFRRFTIIYISCYICLKIYFCFRSLRCCRWVSRFSRRPPEFWSCFSIFRFVRNKILLPIYFCST